MEKIKFKAWDKENNYMIDSMQSIRTIVSYFISGDKRKNQYELIQYVGRKDVNDIEIYEYYYIRVSTLNGRGEAIIDEGLLVYEPEALQYLLLKNDGKKYHFDFYGNLTILGNKFKNPELLNKTGG